MASHFELDLVRFAIALDARRRGIFSLADFDELLDVGHFFRHDGENY